MLNVVPFIGLNESFNNALRTEDIRFSPSGRVLAVVATSGNIFLFACDIHARPIRISKHTTLHSDSLASPHGIDFISEDMVVVANRTGWLTFYRIPGMNKWEENMSVEPIHEMESPWFGRKGSTRKSGDRTVSCGPGSVRIWGDRLFACCNNQHTVTTHPYRLKRSDIETMGGAILVQDGLEIPDGLALSRDGQWLAVGDHNFRSITVFRLSDMSPVCTLSDAELSHPHGICFDPTGQALYVADAGERGIHVFVSSDTWTTSMNSSTFTLAAVEAEAFQKTKDSVPEKYRSLEGGIKGLDVDASGRLIATTCQNQMLRFFESELGPIASSSANLRARCLDGVRRLLGRTRA